MLSRSHTANHTPTIDNMDDDINAIDWIIKADELQKLDDSAVLQSLLELLDAQK